MKIGTLAPYLVEEVNVVTVDPQTGALTGPATRMPRLRGALVIDLDMIDDADLAAAVSAPAMREAAGTDPSGPVLVVGATSSRAAAENVMALLDGAGFMRSITFAEGASGVLDGRRGVWISADASLEVLLPRDPAGRPLVVTGFSAMTTGRSWGAVVELPSGRAGAASTMPALPSTPPFPSTGRMTFYLTATPFAVPVSGGWLGSLAGTQGQAGDQISVTPWTAIGQMYGRGAFAGAGIEADIVLVVPYAARQRPALWGNWFEERARSDAELVAAAAFVLGLRGAVVAWRGYVTHLTHAGQVRLVPEAGMDVIGTDVVITESRFSMDDPSVDDGLRSFARMVADATGLRLSAAATSGLTITGEMAPAIVPALRVAGSARVISRFADFLRPLLGLLPTAGLDLLELLVPTEQSAAEVDDGSAHFAVRFPLTPTAPVGVAPRFVPQHHLVHLPAFSEDSLAAVLAEVDQEALDPTSLERVETDPVSGGRGEALDEVSHIDEIDNAVRIVVDQVNDETLATLARSPALHHLLGRVGEVAVVVSGMVATRAVGESLQRLIHTEGFARTFHVIGAPSGVNTSGSLYWASSRSPYHLLGTHLLPSRPCVVYSQFVLSNENLPTALVALPGDKDSFRDFVEHANGLRRPAKDVYFEHASDDDLAGGGYEPPPEPHLPRCSPVRIFLRADLRAGAFLTRLHAPEGRGLRDKIQTSPWFGAARLYAQGTFQGTGMDFDIVAAVSDFGSPGVVDSPVYFSRNIPTPAHEFQMALAVLGLRPTVITWDGVVEVRPPDGYLRDGGTHSVVARVMRQHDDHIRPAELVVLRPDRAGAMSSYRHSVPVVGDAADEALVDLADMLADAVVLRLLALAWQDGRSATDYLGQSAAPRVKLSAPPAFVDRLRVTLTERLCDLLEQHQQTGHVAHADRIVAEMFAGEEEASEWTDPGSGQTMVEIDFPVVPVGMVASEYQPVAVNDLDINQKLASMFLRARGQANLLNAEQFRQAWDAAFSIVSQHLRFPRVGLRAGWPDLPTCALEVNLLYLVMVALLRDGTVEAVRLLLRVGPSLGFSSRSGQGSMSPSPPPARSRQSSAE